MIVRMNIGFKRCLRRRAIISTERIRLGWKLNIDALTEGIVWMHT